MRSHIEQKKRIIIKIGSALLVDAGYQLNETWLNALAYDVASLKEKGIEVIIVSSGSVALGRQILRCTNRKCTLAEKQAAASIGQIQLANAYKRIFYDYKMNVAQVLLSIDDSETRHRYINAQNTLQTLLKFNVVPIINENDTVATTEISYGDNDRLAARVAQMVEADLLILLSDIDGLYSANPHFEKTAKFIPIVDKIDADIRSMAGQSHTKISSGGMITKIMAAEIATKNGCDMILCRGNIQNPIAHLLKQERYTLFKAQPLTQNAKKRWLAHHLQHQGQIVVDAGTVEALLLGNSLLAAGVTACDGMFKKGDIVNICDQNRQVIAVGMVNFSQETLDKIKGKTRQQIEMYLNNKNVKAVVHRNDMVVV